MNRNGGPVNKQIAHAAELIRSAQYGIALTGAGISVPSGIPDFRSPGNGLWEQADPVQVASVFAVRHHPESFFEWLQPLANKMFSARPNPAHQALAHLETAGWLKAIITQNIDGLHQQAGSRRVLEVHGHIRQVVCLRCYTPYASEQFKEGFLMIGRVPRCPDCNGVLKPAITLFGEQLPVQVAMTAIQEVRRCDLVLVAGSSLEVLPVAGWPNWAHRQGARLIIVNLQATYLDEVADVIFRADVAEVLPQLVQACQAMTE